MIPKSSTYVVASFDVLGFSNRLKRDGLLAIASQYARLIGLADEHNAHVARVFGTIRLKESAYWAAGGEIAVLQKVSCAYASDSLLVWAHAAFPKARKRTTQECAELAKDRKLGWQYLPVPCDSFLDLCNDFICLGLEIGLPLRGAISMGTCILDKPSGVYLGLPLVENAGLEKAQELIGASFCSSFLEQTVPDRFKLAFSDHLKPNADCAFGGYTLDWPRHWRRTRQGAARPKLRRLGRGSGDAIKYYDKTLRFLNLSEGFKDRYESKAETDIRSVYTQFSSPDVMCDIRPVRQYSGK